jgi:hypothetical protein
MLSRQKFLSVLDDLALPHRSTVRDLRARYGMTRSIYYGWNIIEAVDAKPISPQQVGAFNFTEYDGPDLLPPISFSALISSDAEARRNHQKTLESLSAVLGEIPADKSASNTIGHIWHFETAALEIVTWPPELNRHHVNPATSKHPELAHFCQLRLTNGYRPPLTPQEQAWVREVTPFAHQTPDTRPDVVPFDLPWNGANRAVYRWLPPAWHGRHVGVATSRDRQALVGIDRIHAFVVPRADLRAVRLDHILPARGSGGSSLAVDYVNRFATAQPTGKLRIFRASKVDGLDRLADEVAAWAGVDLTTTEYSDE